MRAAIWDAGGQVSDSDEPTRLPRPGYAVAGASRSLVADDHDLIRGLVESVHHHLRTPLTVVLGHAELLADQEHDLPAQVRQSLGAVLRAARRLDDVVLGVCDLVSMACVDPRAVDSVDLMELVTEETAAYRDLGARRGVRFLISGEHVQACLADPGLLRRALRELLDNAVTYAPDQSVVRIVTTAGSTGIRITVSDYGEGIALCDRERLAKPFERGTHPRQRPAGRGLGLALASVVAASLGGRLLISGSPGIGLKVCIELPVGTALRNHAAVADTLAQS